MMMIRNGSRWTILPVIVTGLLFANGCSDPSKPVPVRGQLLAAGNKPATGAIVVFHPIAGNSAAIKPTGQVKEDGSFTLTTNSPDDGAPPGEYGVTVVWLAKKAAPKIGEDHSLGKDQLFGRYSDAKSPRLKATVKSGDANEIKLTVE